MPPVRINDRRYFSTSDRLAFFSSETNNAEFFYNMAFPRGSFCALGECAQEEYDLLASTDNEIKSRLAKEYMQRITLDRFSPFAQQQTQFRTDLLRKHSDEKMAHSKSPSTQQRLGILRMFSALLPSVRVISLVESQYELDQDWIEYFGGQYCGIQELLIDVSRPQ